MMRPVEHQRKRSRLVVRKQPVRRTFSPSFRQASRPLTGPYQPDGYHYLACENSTRYDLPDDEHESPKQQVAGSTRQRTRVPAPWAAPYFCIAPRCLPDLPLIRVDLIPGSHTQTFDLACPSGVRCSASREDVGLVREKGAAEMGRRGWASGLFGWRRRPPGGQSAPAASGLTTFGDFTHEELAD